MTTAQATAEVFWTAFQALKKTEREAFLYKLLQDENFTEDLRYAMIIENRKNEPRISLNDYLRQHSNKK